MNENHSKFAISASQCNLKLVSSESGHSSCWELPFKIHLLSHMLRLVFPRALEELGAPIHDIPPRICKNFSNFLGQDYCSANGVVQVCSFLLSRSWVYTKKREETGLLFHKYFFIRFKFLSCFELRWKVNFSPPPKCWSPPPSNKARGDGLKLCQEGLDWILGKVASR